MKTFASSLVAIAIAIAAGQAAAAPQIGTQTATLNAAAAQAHHIDNLKKYGGPKANPSGIHVGGGAGSAVRYDEYCGTGKKPIPGVGPVGGGAGGGLAMNDPERCGSTGPRIPGGFGPGPR
jgi:hypothetical protein